MRFSGPKKNTALKVTKEVMKEQKDGFNTADIVSPTYEKSKHIGIPCMQAIN